TEMILPADEHSPGARAAQVAAYIDRCLAESVDPKAPALWRAGLKRFLDAPEDQRLTLLTEVAAQEGDPHTPAEYFFKELKSRTVRGYYTSDIGIHKELEYLGNTHLDAFVGYEP